VEEWFYILWAPLVLTFRRSTVVVIIAAAIVGAFLFRWLVHSDFLILYQNLMSQTDMLAIGSALAIHRASIGHWTIRSTYTRHMLLSGAFLEILGATMLGEHCRA
jgi:peptidoglycan/LPS O-acetylase OafA/YrhL